MEFAFQLTQLLHVRNIYMTYLVYKDWDYLPAYSICVRTIYYAINVYKHYYVKKIKQL